MKFFILTDLEGVAGTDSFSQTRTMDSGPSGRGPSMKQLAKEVNACAAGIRQVYPDAVIDVLDGHGGGKGLWPEDLDNCGYLDLKNGARPHHHLEDYAAMLFVGQHAMAGTIDAPLNHTYSSREVMYYRLNDVYIGEFGSRALVAGIQGVPTIFLAGDDKAALEAKMFIPQIETVVTKFGTGLESAIHLDLDEACRLIHEGAERAVRRMSEIPPYTRFQPPYVLEARYYEPFADTFWERRPDHQKVDERTYRVETADLFKLPF